MKVNSRGETSHYRSYFELWTNFLDKERHLRLPFAPELKKGCVFPDVISPSGKIRTVPILVMYVLLICRSIYAGKFRMNNISTFHVESRIVLQHTFTWCVQLAHLDSVDKYYIYVYIYGSSEGRNSREVPPRSSFSRQRAEVSGFSETPPETFASDSDSVSF